MKILYKWHILESLAPFQTVDTKLPHRIYKHNIWAKFRTAEYSFVSEPFSTFKDGRKIQMNSLRSFERKKKNI